MGRNREHYLAYQRDYGLNRYRDRKANHQCTRCGKVTPRTEAGMVYCWQCAVDFSKRNKRYYDKKRKIEREVTKDDRT